MPEQHSTSQTEALADGLEFMAHAESIRHETERKLRALDRATEARRSEILGEHEVLLARLCEREREREGRLR